MQRGLLLCDHGSGIDFEAEKGREEYSITYPKGEREEVGYLRHSTFNIKYCSSCSDSEGHEMSPHGYYSALERWYGIRFCIYKTTFYLYLTHKLASCGTGSPVPEDARPFQPFYDTLYANSYLRERGSVLSSSPLAGVGTILTCEGYQILSA